MKDTTALRQPWLAWGWLTLVVMAALLTPTAHQSPDLQHINEPPFHSVHWLGTTPQGLDVGLSLLQGARTVVLVSVPAALLTLLLGAALGGIAGFWGDTRLRVARWPTVAALVAVAAAIGALPYSSGWVSGALGLAVLAGAWALWAPRHSPAATWPLPLDSLILGLISLLNSVPLLVLVVAVSAVQRPSLPGVVMLLGATCWPTPARLFRAATLQSNSQPYVEAARASGISSLRILWRHIGPNVLPVLLVRFPLTVAILLGLETTLSFLGAGLPPETPSWGRLLATVRQAPTDWWLIAGPGFAIACTLLSLHQLTTKRH
ncbi:ABC transporter permease [Hymenobacter sp. 102]|uniref:ABC transporter permease n=1 Tax=Hymenobacter sp. 102 TaxID=3403152 RepID=UPI003CF1E33F